MRFSTKLNSMTITLVVLCTLALGAVFWYFLVREVKASRFRYANQMGELLISDPDVILAMHTADTVQLAQYFDEVVKRQKNLLFIAVLKADGNFLVDTSRGEAGKLFAWKELLVPSANHGIRSLVRRDLTFKDKPEDVYLALLPIFSHGETWGFVAFGFSFRELFHTTLPKVFMLLTASWLTLSALCALALFVFIQSQTQPIQDLMAGVGQISAGNFNYSIQERSRDELGALAAMFNRMSQSLRETFSRLQQLSPVDDITHIYNQNFFHTLLNQELARAFRYHYPVTLVLLRLTNYEAVKQGLQKEFAPALVRLTRAFQECIRNTDNLARYREDTWAMVLIQSDRKNAQPVIERIKRAAEAFQEGRDQALNLGLQLGLADAQGQGNQSVPQEQLLAQAEGDLKKV